MYWHPAASRLPPGMAPGGWRGPAQPETPDVAGSSIIPGMTASKPCHAEPHGTQMLGCSGTSGRRTSDIQCLLRAQRDVGALEWQLDASLQGYKHAVV